MAVVSLELFKKHVYADDFTGDDVYLQHLLDTAEITVINATHRSVEEIYDTYGKFPLPLKHAVMMVAAHWYNQRESVSSVQMHTVPGTLQALVKPYVKLVDE